MNERQAELTDPRSSEHAADNEELKLELKVLRVKLRTALRGGTGGPRTDTNCPAIACDSMVK
jgi:hypothetical protein